MAEPNFYGHNRHIAFPFERGTVGVSTPESGSVTMLQLPPDFVVDCGFEMGPLSGYEEDTHRVYLRRIYRQGTTVYFEMACTAPELLGHYLTFERDVSDVDYSTEFVESVTDTALLNSISLSEIDLCGEPMWSGYLVSGSMASIAARLSDGAQISNLDETPTAALVEPALVYNLDKGMVVALHCANVDRTRTTDPCEELPDEEERVEQIFNNPECFQGLVYLQAGYNCTITQDDEGGTITIGAAVGAGKGQPCDEVPLYVGELPVEEGGLLSGGPRCAETLRSINGVGGPMFTFYAGAGVSIVPDTENNKLTVNVDMQDLAVCFSFSAVSESV